MVEINHKAWSETMMSFIKARGLERELTDYAGGWKCPVTPSNFEAAAWVIPGTDNARADGSIDAMAWSEGEFTKPLYADPFNCKWCHGKGYVPGDPEGAPIHECDRCGGTGKYAAPEVVSLSVDPASFQALKDENERLQERVDEAELIIGERDDRMALVDRIADLIGLPDDQELDQVAFELWLSALKDEVAAKDARIARLEIVAKFADEFRWFFIHGDGESPLLTEIEDVRGFTDCFIKLSDAIDRATLRKPGREPDAIKTAKAEEHRLRDEFHRDLEESDMPGGFNG